VSEKCEFRLDFGPIRKSRTPWGNKWLYAPELKYGNPPSLSEALVFICTYFIYNESGAKSNREIRVRRPYIYTCLCAETLHLHNVAKYVTSMNINPAGVFTKSKYQKLVAS